MFTKFFFERVLDTADIFCLNLTGWRSLLSDGENLLRDSRSSFLSSSPASKQLKSVNRPPDQTTLLREILRIFFAYLLDSVGKRFTMSLETIPKDLRHLRACLSCSLIKVCVQS